jgi:hypothetical protein
MHHARQIRVEPQMIGRVLANIIGNAVQAMVKSGATMNPGGRLWFHTREVARAGGVFLELVIGNSGSYIAPEDIPRLFEPFFTRGKKGGTGLGLAVVEKIVRDHGGRVGVVSDRDAGTEFRITLPASAALNRTTAALPTSSGQLLAAPEPLDRAPAAPSAQVANAAVAQAAIAVIDDDPFALDAWREAWRGAVVHVFASPPAFFAALEREAGFTATLAAVVTDHFFDDHPEWTSERVAAALAARGGPPVIVCSSLFNGLAPHADVAAYIDKVPLAPAALLALAAGAAKPKAG